MIVLSVKVKHITVNFMTRNKYCLLKPLGNLVVVCHFKTTISISEIHSRMVASSANIGSTQIVPLQIVSKCAQMQLLRKWNAAQVSIIELTFRSLCEINRDLSTDHDARNCMLFFWHHLIEASRVRIAKDSVFTRV